MEIIFDEIEARVLGALMEKEMSTPEYYPMTINSLTHACNQKNNREPVVNYDETTVEQALARLEEKNLVWQTIGGRGVVKYGQRLTKNLNLVPQEAALLCEILLRGPQTAGELKSHCERLSHFETITQVLESLQNLVALKLITKLARQPGQKEARFAHLFFGVPEAEKWGGEPETPPHEVFPAFTERLQTLESELTNLKKELGELREEFRLFKKQFE